MKCFCCDGTAKEAKDIYKEKLEDKTIVIKDVPAFVCENCFETFYTANVMDQIENVSSCLNFLAKA